VCKCKFLLVITIGFDFLKFTRFLRRRNQRYVVKLLETCSNINLTDEPGRVLTKGEFVEKGRKKVELCEFCDDCETQEHLLFSCPLANYIWNVTTVALGINSIPTCFGELYKDWFGTNSSRGRRAITIGSVAII
jgi:hypothetical protein